MHTTNLNFHTFTSYPFILTKRSTFILALHPFYSKLSSTNSSPHSPTPLPYKRHNSPLFPFPLQNSQNTPFLSTSNSITPPQSSLSPFQHPFNNHLPSASNQTTSHLTNTNTLPQTHHTLPLPFANPSLTLPPKKRKHNTHNPLSLHPPLLSIQKKAQQCIFTTSRFTNRRWCNARSMVGAVCADVRDTGNFSSPKTEEFIISRGNIIELWRLDESGNVNVICSYEVYGLIRSLKPFRLSGTIQSTSIMHRKRHGFHSHRLGQRTHRGAAVQRRNERL